MFRPSDFTADLKALIIEQFVGSATLSSCELDMKIGKQIEPAIVLILLTTQS